MVYWLKTQTDIDSYGYAYDSTCFSIDESSINIKFGATKRKYQVKKIIGNGASISGGDTYSDRTIALSRIFKTDKVSVSGALNSVRTNFINKFIASNENIYLIRNYNGDLQAIQVYPVMGDESYKTLIVSEAVDITLLCELPFFKSVIKTTLTPFTKSTRYFDTTISNPGLLVPFIFECDFSSADSLIRIGIYENYGAAIQYPFSSGSHFKLDSGTLRTWVNGIEFFGKIKEGTPFYIPTGSNNLRIESISNLTNCSISYYGRYL